MLSAAARVAAPGHGRTRFDADSRAFHARAGPGPRRSGRRRRAAARRPRGRSSDAFAGARSAGRDCFAIIDAIADRARSAALHRLCRQRPGGDGGRHPAQRAGRRGRGIASRRRTRSAPTSTAPIAAVRDPNAYSPPTSAPRSASAAAAIRTLAMSAGARARPLLAASPAAVLGLLRRRRRRRWRQRRAPPAPAPPPRRPASTPPRRRGAEQRRGAADHRPGGRRGAGAQPAGGDRGGRPGRQCAGRLPHDRRARDLRRSPPRAERRQHRRAGRQSSPARAGAIAKAITGAYLSIGGNAFSTRTASKIVQEHFPPAAAAPRAGKRAAVRRAVQPAALLGPVARFSATAAPAR